MATAGASTNVKLTMNTATASSGAALGATAAAMSAGTQVNNLGGSSSEVNNAGNNEELDDDFRGNEFCEGGGMEEFETYAQKIRDQNPTLSNE